MNSLRLLAGFLGLLSVLQAVPDRSLLLVSIDGLRPDYLSEADRHGLKISHLHGAFLARGLAAWLRVPFPSAPLPPLDLFPPLGK